LLRDYSAIPGGDIVVYAVLLAVLALLLPQGIAGWFAAKWLQRRSGRRAARVTS
jgi:branched-chain amino acid transport system permease protein